VNPDTIGCVWTGDLNTLHADGEIFESGKKKLRIQKYLDTYTRHEKLPLQGIKWMVKGFVNATFARF